MEKPEIVERDGIKYLRLICPHCKSELLFKVHEEERRVHFVCKTCGKMMETIVPASKDIK